LTDRILHRPATLSSAMLRQRREHIPGLCSCLRLPFRLCDHHVRPRADTRQLRHPEWPQPHPMLRRRPRRRALTSQLMRRSTIERTLKVSYKRMPWCRLPFTDCQPASWPTRLMACTSQLPSSVAGRAGRANSSRGCRGVPNRYAAHLETRDPDCPTSTSRPPIVSSTDHRVPRNSARNGYVAHLSTGLIPLPAAGRSTA
jgi:hypothetical protein